MGNRSNRSPVFCVTDVDGRSADSGEEIRDGKRESRQDVFAVEDVAFTKSHDRSAR
jgi:hypothetical protein